jgi:hypothetical protein
MRANKSFGKMPLQEATLGPLGAPKWRQMWHLRGGGGSLQIIHLRRQRQRRLWAGDVACLQSVEGRTRVVRIIRGKWRGHSLMPN